MRKNNLIKDKSIKSLKDLAYKKISKLLVDGVLQPDQPISESELVNILNLGRTPVREAILMLEQEGLVRIYPRRGIFINRISIKDVKELFEIREALESIATRLTTKKGLKKDIEEIEKLFDKAEKEKNFNKELRAYDEIHDVLHEFILDNCGNLRIKKIINNYRTLLLLQQQIAISIPSRAETSFREHKEILGAMKLGNAVEAEQKMKHHIISTYKDIIKELE